jgi:hypothetical protein
MPDQVGKVTSLNVMDYPGGTGCRANITDRNGNIVQVTTSSLFLTGALQTLFVSQTLVDANYDANSNQLNFIFTNPT